MSSFQFVHSKCNIPKCTENHKEIQPQIGLYELAFALDEMSEITIPYSCIPLALIGSAGDYPHLKLFVLQNASAGVTLNFWPFDD